MSARSNAWFLLVMLVGLGVVLFSGSRWAIRPVNPFLSALAPVQRVLTAGAYSVRSFLDGLTRGWRLEAENQALREELQGLNGEVARLRQAENENEQLRTLLQFQRTNPQWHYVAADVVAYEGQRLAKTVVIDRGSDQGVELGVVAVVAGGLVGRVVEVGPGAARVLLLTDPRSAVNIQFQQSGATGIVRALADGELVVDFVERDAPVQVGDLATTSGLGGSYPAGILVGQVVEVVPEERSRLFLRVRLRPAVAFDRLRHLLIIEDFTPLVFP